MQIDKQQISQAPWVGIHSRAVRCAQNLKSAYGELLEVLIEVEAEEVFYQLEKTSLFRYCVDVLLLPKHTAYDFIDVVRTSKEIPALAQAVIEGRATISNARRVCSVITVENQAPWIDLVCECPQSTIQKCVAMAKPKSAVPEKLEYVSGDLLKIEFAVSEEWAELLKETKDLLSTRERRAVSTEEALFILMAENKKRDDPVKKAERALKRKSGARPIKPVHCAESSDAATSRNTSRYRPAHVEHEVDLRDQNQCAYVDQSGDRCKEKRWLHKHHIVEFSKGGAHSVENLETLCWGHHRMKHRVH